MIGSEKMCHVEKKHIFIFVMIIMIIIKQLMFYIYCTLFYSQ